MNSILDETVREATVIELVLAVATAVTFSQLIQSLGIRLFVDEDFVVFSTGQWLGAPLFAFAVCTALLAISVYVRMRSRGLFDRVEEPVEDA